MTDYRYTLHRSCETVLACRGRLCFVMLNPSTADDRLNDPTIRRCIGFTRTNQYREMEVVNLFAARSTRPKYLTAIDDPVGPENDVWITEAIMKADTVVFAWGASIPRQLDAHGRAVKVWSICRSLGRRPQCLGFTGNGSPRHPLYVPASQQFEDWK